MNLSGTIGFLKEMGRGQKTKELIRHYVGARVDDGPEFWDLGSYPFANDVKDPDVIAAFKQKFDAVASRPDPAEIEKGGIRQMSNSFPI